MTEAKIVGIESPDQKNIERRGPGVEKALSPPEGGDICLFQLSVQFIYSLSCGEAPAPELGSPPLTIR
jgi:hypothetical protein